MIAFPNAKINIGLNIVNKRADGYHDLETIFYPVMVKDVLEIVESKELSFTSSGLTIPGIPEDNICLKAYKLLSQEMKLPPVNIYLHKNIPLGAGLGGGSADASFFITLMNRKFSLGLSDEQMGYYASQLGADCTFFIRNRPVVGTGRGDKLEDIHLDLSKYFIVIIMPPVQVSTAEAFKDIVAKPSDRSAKGLTTDDIKQWKEYVKNDFETGIISRYPIIRSIKDFLYQSGAIYASMSGSGSSVYGIFSEPIKLAELEINNRVFYGV